MRILCRRSVSKGKGEGGGGGKEGEGNRRGEGTGGETSWLCMEIRLLMKLAQLRRTRLKKETTEYKYFRIKRKTERRKNKKCKNSKTNGKAR
jgi:hypothetical protein